jgi:glyoxylase-like metal-dependent hydrolase (beta-lactamase superfamily II)
MSFLVEVAEGILQVKIPIPFPIKFVNCYLIREPGGCFLIDAGLNYERGRDTWVDFFQKEGMEFSDLKGILITHFHPDHFGAVGWLQERSGAKVYMSRIELERARMFWNPDVPFNRIDIGHLVENGIPARLAEQIGQSMGQNFDYGWVKPDPVVETIADGEKLAISGLIWDILVTPGHSDGHVCLYNPERKIIFAGDQLLPGITSNVSFFPGALPNPLKDYLQSLCRLKSLDIEVVLPAHGDIFKRAGKRVDELLKHHRERLELICRAADGGKTAFEVSQEVFSSNLSLDDTRFALGETLAHLKYLVHEDRLIEKRKQGVVFYCRH